MNELIVNSYPKASVTVAINSVRLNLKFNEVKNKIKTILVTSSTPSEGKSFISANLATTYAQAGEKVLLIDCDFRRGRQNEIFKKQKSFKGLSNLLIEDNWEKEITKYLQKTDIKNLSVLTSGVTPPNSTLLFESDRMVEVVDYLKSKFDIIIFDTPPVGSLNDALVISKLSDVVLITAAAKRTKIEELENTKKKLESVNANIGGVILNKVDVERTKYYDNSYNRYYEEII